MMIVIIVLTVVIVLASVAFAVFYIIDFYKQRKKLIYNNNIASQKYKKELQTNNNYGDCARAFYGLVESCEVTTQTLVNSRRSKYSDTKESNRLCNMLTNDRVEKVNEIDKKTYYGQY